MNILLTGASGFVGAAITHLLLERGHRVRAVYLPEDPLLRIADLGERVTYCARNLYALSEEEWDALVAGCDVCIHAAWYTVPGLFSNSEENLSCVEMTLALLRALARNNVPRFVGLGTCAEYDLYLGDTPLPETAPLRPSTLYAASKVAAFEVARAYARLHALSFAWCRLFFLYGYGEPPGRVVPDVIRNLLKGKSAAVSAGRQELDYLYVEDAARAVVAVAERDLQGPINVGSGETVSVRSVIERVATHLGRPELVQWGARPSNPNEPGRICADNTRLRTETDWRPLVDWTEGITRTVAWWQAHR